MTPWAIEAPDQFRAPGPQSPASAQYAAELNETKDLGSSTSATRSADQTLLAQFWNASTVSYFWDTAALALSAQRGYSMSDKARLLATLNVAMADAAIACWDSKYTYLAWRPVTAIPLADTDGNPATIADPAWKPLLTTPNHPEYPSGHSTVSGAAGAVLTSFFGDNNAMTFDSDVLPNVLRSFSSISDVLEEIQNARICGGIHFRTACVDGQALGNAVGNYVADHVAQRIHGH